MDLVAVFFGVPRQCAYVSLPGSWGAIRIAPDVQSDAVFSALIVDSGPVTVFCDRPCALDSRTLHFFVPT